MEQWLCQDFVAVRWGKLTREELLAVANHAIITANGENTGYIRWQHPTREELDTAGLTDIPTEFIDIDIFIGVKSMLGKGIGSEAVNILVERILEEEPGVPAFMAYAAHDNSASIKGCLRKLASNRTGNSLIQNLICLPKAVPDCTYS